MDATEQNSKQHPSLERSEVSPITSIRPSGLKSTPSPRAAWISQYAQVLAQKDVISFEHSFRVEQWMNQWCDDLEKRARPEIQTFLKHHRETLIWASLLHDLGKIGVLDQILHSEEKLSESERKLLEMHAELGYQLIRDLPGASDGAEWIRYHHERYDGRGYPLGLKGKHIPFGARMISIVDAFDAMTRDRPYRKAQSFERALMEIEANAGSQFCPELSMYFIEFVRSQNL